MDLMQLQDQPFCHRFKRGAGAFWPVLLAARSAWPLAHRSTSCILCSLFFPVKISERKPDWLSEFPLSFHARHTVVTSPPRSVHCGQGGRAHGHPGHASYRKELGKWVFLLEQASLLLLGLLCGTGPCLGQSHTAVKCQRQGANPDMLMPKPLNHQLLISRWPFRDSRRRYRGLERGSLAKTEMWPGREK